ncbi:MAG: hypothetical protein HC896_18560 [Bacteroidales bacterium]|nr:hypothetical protein [Bacteroidales bacterium]
MAMQRYNIIKTFPGEERFQQFESLPVKLYRKNSASLHYWFSPVAAHLEGCYFLEHGNKVVGRFAFYQNPHLSYEKQSAACLGSYECINNTNVSNVLLKQAMHLAKDKGHTWLVGPMEGSTWNNYRFTNHNQYRNFFLEPCHHSYYNLQFIKAGFVPLANYFSKLDENLAYDEEKLNKFEQHFINQGAIFRNLNMDDLHNELKKIASCSLAGFSNNLFFTPIAIDDFIDKYKSLAKYIDPGLVYIVDNANKEIQAFMFAIKDYTDSQGKTIIIKSLAKIPGTSFKGIGSYLTGKIVQTAKKRGYKKIIHAFMVKDNHSVSISNKYGGKEFKSHTLYGIKL